MLVTNLLCLQSASKNYFTFLFLHEHNGTSRCGGSLQKEKVSICIKRSLNTLRFLISIFPDWNLGKLKDVLSKLTGIPPEDQKLLGLDCNLRLVSEQLFFILISPEQFIEWSLKAGTPLENVLRSRSETKVITHPKRRCKGRFKRAFSKGL